AGELELHRLDVDADQMDARELLPKHGQYCADAASDLQQARPGGELGAVCNQPVPPMLCLLHEPLLLPRAVAVDVVGHLPTTSYPQPAEGLSASSRSRLAARQSLLES